jgi:hypothetical protein
MIAFMSSVLRSGELANCSLVLLAACCFSRFGFQQFALDDVVDLALMLNTETLTLLGPLIRFT